MVAALPLPFFTLPFPFANLTLLFDVPGLRVGLTGVGGSEKSVSPDSSASESVVVVDEHEDRVVVPEIGEDTGVGRAEF